MTGRCSPLTRPWTRIDQGATPITERLPLVEIQLDLLLPCSISGLLTPAMVAGLNAKVVVPAANAPFENPELADVLRQRAPSLFSPIRSSMPAL